MKTVIIGTGPAGLMAAIMSARNGNETIIIDSQAKLGKKIYATGNGRCNFTNRDMKSPDLFRGDAALAKKIVNKFNNNDLIAFFNELGVIERDINGYIYPNSEQASSIAETLVSELKRLKVCTVLNQKVIDIKVSKHGFDVFTSVDMFSADKVVIAVGGQAAPVHGSDGNLNKLIKKLGHSFVKQVPALVNLEHSDKKLDKLAGVRTRCGICLVVNGQVVSSEKGEIIFNKGNISGIPVMQVSRYAAYALNEKKDVSLKINLLNELSMDELSERLRAAIYGPMSKNKSVFEVLTGTLNSKLLEYALKEAGIGPDKAAYALKPQQFNNLLQVLTELTVRIKATGNFEKAQVTAGGVNTKELDQNLQSKLVKNLYFAGEIVDVDGTCGGYNLQWAFSSGYVVGSKSEK